MNEDTEINNLSTIIKTLNSLVEDNLIVLTHCVKEIIGSNCKDERYIESTLDRLLDLCFDDNFLVLYKKLCRYYYKLNPEATIDYVRYYLDMYDDENDGLPSDIKIPTKETLKAINELEEKKSKTHNNVDELFKDLDS